MATNPKAKPPKPLAAAPAPTGWRNRIVGEGMEDADQLLANPRNWRVHPKAQQEALEGVLREVGWVQRVIVNQRTGFVLDGHARVAMAISRGEKVPVVYVDLSEEEEALILATLDPLAAMAGTDQELLQGLVSNLNVENSAINALLETLCPCGDSTAKDATERVCGGTVPFLMVTDPPYGVEYDPSWRDEHNTTPGPNKTFTAANRARGTVANDDRADWAPAYSLFPGSVAYVWHAGVFAGEVAVGLVSAAFQIRAQIIWKKQHFVFGRGSYHWGHEPCWYAVRRGANANWHGDRKQSTVWEVQNLNPMGGNKDEKATGHGTQKPVELMLRPIRNHTVTGDAVYDPFLGSGTTLIACEQTGRVCLGIDIDPKYVDVIIRRWQDFTGKAATDENGETFESIERERLGTVPLGDRQAAEAAA